MRDIGDATRPVEPAIGIRAKDSDFSARALSCHRQLGDDNRDLRGWSFELIIIRPDLVPEVLEVLMMAEANAFRAGTVVVATGTSGASAGIGPAAACTIATAATATIDVRHQGGDCGIERTLITALDRLKEVRNVVFDVTGGG